ncbi:MAG: FxsA family protein [Paracoccaceae bacterium]
MRLFLLFMFVPLIEIALFIQVGGFIGLWWTLAIVILTAALGTFLVRSQGMAVMAQLRGSLENLSDPTEPMAHGAMVLFSGALLLTPGFFTDVVGFALMVPGIRSKIYQLVRSRITVQTVNYGQPTEPADSSVIDADYEEVDPSPQNGPSGWTRH